MFFIIAAGVMSLLIVSIHRLAKHFGCELPLSSLVLCGLCAIVINFLIISVTPFLTKSYYYTAGAMITFAAFGTTCYNKYLLHRKLRLAGSGAISPAELAEMPPPGAQDEPDAVAMLLEAVPEAVPKAVHEDAPAETELSVPAAQTEPVETAGTAEIIEPMETTEPAESIEPIQPVEPAKPMELAKPSEHDMATSSKAETAATASAETMAASDAPGYADANDIESDVNIDATADTDTGASADTDTDANIDTNTDTGAETDAGMVTEAEAVDDGIAAKLASMTTMDQLLDFAFEHSMQKNHPVALAAYTEALARYRDDSYAPFIVVSIANIHKELGNYQAAIDNIRSAMALPALLENESIRSQFEDTLLYLTATRKVLQKAGLGDISFKDIPKKYMSQIESIYNSRKSR